MAWLRVILSGITTLTLSVIGGPFILLYPTIKSENATALAAVAGGLTGALHTPLFWLSGLLLFFPRYVGRLHNKIPVFFVVSEVDVDPSVSSVVNDPDVNLSNLPSKTSRRAADNDSWSP
jgi:hypothetical protein